MDNTAVETLYRFRRTNFTAVVMGLGGLAITGRSHRIVFNVFFERFGRPVAIDRSLFQRFQDNAIQITTELPTQSGVGSGGRTPTSV